jgi:hypothetical protein
VTSFSSQFGIDLVVIALSDDENENSVGVKRINNQILALVDAPQVAALQPGGIGRCRIGSQGENPANDLPVLLGVKPFKKPICVAGQGESTTHWELLLLTDLAEARLKPLQRLLRSQKAAPDRLISAGNPISVLQVTQTCELSVIQNDHRVATVILDHHRFAASVINDLTKPIL